MQELEELKNMYGEMLNQVREIKGKYIQALNENILLYKEIDDLKKSNKEWREKYINAKKEINNSQDVIETQNKVINKLEHKGVIIPFEK